MTTAYSHYLTLINQVYSTVMHEVWHWEYFLLTGKISSLQGSFYLDIK